MPTAVAVTISFLGKSRSARSKKWVIVSGRSCISPFIAPPKGSAVRIDGLDPENRGTPPRWLLPVMIVPMVALWVIAIVGDVLAAGLVDTHPLVLIAMNPRIRNLVLVVNQVDPVW